jgi:small subunit ribosomal protein S2
MESTVIRALLENGAHFGHQKNKWNPKMKQYIFGEKNGIYIIDLEKTEEALKEAEEFLYNITKEGKTILFVGTKKQAKQIIKEEAVKSGMFYIDERWLGGCLTNFETIRRSVKRLKYLDEMKTTKVYESLAKKEKVKLQREEDKLLKNLRGIKEMNALPGAIVVVDTETEKIAVKEANKMGIPVVAMLDTNCDPDVIQYPIPANDDAIRAIKYVMTKTAEAIMKGRAEYDAKGPALKKMEDPDSAEDKGDPRQKDRKFQKRGGRPEARDRSKDRP